MSLLRQTVDPEYTVHHSTLVVRDDLSAVDRYDERFGEEGLTLSVTGRLALAGHGWLRATTYADALHVALELHDAAPTPPAPDRGVESMETPFLATAGLLTLDSLVPAAGGATLSLDRPGAHRVRVTKRPAGDDGLERWVLAFWPVSEPMQPPRWHALRPQPDLDEPPHLQWRSVLPYEAIELVDVLSTVDDGLDPDGFSDWGRRHGRGRDFLDTPLLPPLIELSSGFPDRDAEVHADRAAYAEERAAAWRDLAAQLSVASPLTRRDVLPLLVACGLLARDDSGRFAFVTVPPHPRDVLTLSPQRRGMQDTAELHRLHGDLAADVERIVLWSASQSCHATISDLAEQTLAAPSRVRGALAFAMSRGCLDVAGDLLGSVAGLVVTLGAGPTPVESAPVEPTPVERAPRLRRRRRVAAPPPLPTGLGPPPRWGVLADDCLWRWVDGTAIDVPVDDASIERAVRAADGTLLTSYARALFVDDGGAVHDLGPLAPATLDPTGRHVVGIESRYGRRSSTNRLHVVDLATRTRTTMAWPKERWMSDAVYDVDGTVTYLAEADVDDPSSESGAFRWRPGSDPVPEPRRTSPAGSLRWWRDGSGLYLERPDGSVQHLSVSLDVRLAPSGRRLYSFRHDPVAVAVWDLAEQPTAAPRVLGLPEGSRIIAGGPGQPVWESDDHLLVNVDRWAQRQPVRGLRLDVRTGALEGIAIPGVDADGSAVFVEMLASRG